MPDVKQQSEKNLLTDLRNLLLAGAASSQEALCAVLLEQGHDVNQSKISRLLRKIGAVKGKNEFGQVVYYLPKEPAPPPASSHLANLIIEITANETAIIMHTSPGCASFIGRVLDHHRKKFEILGTVAGDDTLLILPLSIKNTADLANNIRRFFFSSEN